MANDQSNSEVGPTYKILFLGACVIIGGGFGWWIKNLDHRVEQAESVATEYRFKLFQLEQTTRRLEEGHLAQDKALYDIERRVMPLERRTP